jgi:hypothetical protein
MPNHLMRNVFRQAISRCTLIKRQSEQVAQRPNEGHQLLWCPIKGNQSRSLRGPMRDINYFGAP